MLKTAGGHANKVPVDSIQTFEISEHFNLEKFKMNMHKTKFSCKKKKKKIIIKKNNFSFIQTTCISY